MFSYYNPVKIITGSECRKVLNNILRKKSRLIFLSRSALQRYSKDPHVTDILFDELTHLESGFSSNPSITEIKTIAKKYSSLDIEVIIGFGGGSAMDIAKLATLAVPAFKKGIGIDELLETQGKSQFIREFELIQVPTTAGTGSEVTPFATVWDYRKQKKLSLSAECLYADIAVVDPDFLKSVPEEVQVSTSLDALNQAFESIWNKKANQITLSYAAQAISLSMPLLMSKSIDYSASDYQKMAMASLMAGLAISQTRTSLCHSISYPLTLKFGVPHGLACAFSMLEVFKHNEPYVRTTINEISEVIGINVYAALGEVLENLNLRNRFLAHVSDAKKIESLVPEMLDVTRASNNIVEVNEKVVREIVLKSAKNLNMN